MSAPCIDVVIFLFLRVQSQQPLNIQITKQSSNQLKPTGTMRVKAQIPEKHATESEMREKENHEEMAG